MKGCCECGEENLKGIRKGHFAYTELGTCEGLQWVWETGTREPAVQALQLRSAGLREGGTNLHLQLAEKEGQTRRQDNLLEKACQGAETPRREKWPVPLGLQGRTT